MSRCALVTGASRGIGRAIALTLSRDGFDVAVHYHTDQTAAEETLRLVQTTGVQARLLRFDVGDRAECQRILELDMETHGPYYGVVCNAGVHADAPFPALSGEAWDRVLQTNLHGFYNVTQPLVMPMVRARWGRIVSVTSVTADIGNRGQVNYAAAKGAIHAASRSLARELGSRGVTVNCVSPGLVDTPMSAGLFEPARIERMIPLQRMGRPEEIASVVAFLASDAAGYITGQVVPVNGGMYM